MLGKRKKNNKKRKRDEIDDGSGQEILSNPKKMNDEEKDIFRRNEEKILKETSGGQYLKDYLNTVKKNSEIFREKMPEKKKFNKKPQQIANFNSLNFVAYVNYILMSTSYNCAKIIRTTLSFSIFFYFLN